MSWPSEKEFTPPWTGNKRQDKKSTNKLKYENDEMTTEQGEILKLIKIYYDKVYFSNKPCTFLYNCTFLIQCSTRYNCSF